MILLEVLSQSAAAAQGMRQGILIGNISFTLIVGIFWLWFLTFLIGPFFATQAPPSERAFKTVVLATIILMFFGLSRNGVFVLLFPLCAVPIYYYRRWRYRRGWTDKDLGDTFR